MLGSTTQLRVILLAPFLFIIVFYCALRKATDNHEELGFTVDPRRSRKTRTEKMSDLNFADGFILLSNDLSTAQQLLHWLNCSTT